MDKRLVAREKVIRRDGYCAMLRDQGAHDALENPNLLRGLAQIMVVKFADYWTEETWRYPARLLSDRRDHLWQPEPTG